MSVKTITVEWEYEDQLPEIDDDTYNKMYKTSKVDFVRMFPYVEICGRRYYLVEEKCQ